MIKMKSKNITLIIIVFSFHFTAFSQDDCRDALSKANSLYEAGKIEACINTLEPCIKTLETKEDFFEGYKLLAIASQDLGLLEKTSTYIKEMLERRPDYQKYPNGDPSFFTKEVAKYTVQPKLSLGVKVGSNINSVRLEQSYSALNELQRYNSSLGYQFGVSGNYLLGSSLSLRSSVLLGGTSIEHEIANEGVWSKNYKENIRFLDFTLGLNKDFQISKKINIFAGLDAGLMVVTQANVAITSLVSSPESYKVDTKNAIDERNTMQPHAGLVTGVSYELERGRFDVEVGYNFFFTNTVIDAKRMSDIDFIFDSQYINDDIKLGLYTLNLVYSLPLNYKISK
jgi:tetratricopeptide (TPR) repeat protein